MKFNLSSLGYWRSKDVYAMGILLYHALSGKVPYAGLLSAQIIVFAAGPQLGTFCMSSKQPLTLSPKPEALNPKP